jgi:hypothetical protein
MNINLPRVLLLGTLISGICRQAQAIPFADSVVSVSPGVGSGVETFNSAGSLYVGPSGPGTYDPTAITLGLDGVSFALGGTTSLPGSIVVHFSVGAVIDGAGADLAIYDSFGGGEGFILDASLNGFSWVNVGSFSGVGAETTTSTYKGANLYTTLVDLAPSGVAAASYFRFTVTNQIIGGYPQALDLDAVEALNFGTGSSVPDAGSTLILFGGALVALVALRHKFICA